MVRFFSSRRFWVATAVLVLVCTIYQLKWGYQTFKIEDATQPTRFIYKRWLDENPDQIRLHIRGRLVGGQAVIKVYYPSSCGNDNVVAHRIHLRGDGAIDTTTSADFYISQACIIYKQHLVKEGNLSVSISIR